MRRRLTVFFCAVAWPTLAMAQETPMPPPTGPVIFCGEQLAPAADTYTLIFDAGAPEPLTMDAEVAAACPAGTTHSFELPAARFPVGTHTLRIVAANAFGSTTGPLYTVLVGIAPGPFEIRAVLPPGD